MAAAAAQQPQALTDKTIAGRYPPGSTFKMVVALAAMEANVAGAAHRVFCNGKHVLGNHTFHCWKRWGHGWVDLNDALAQSCDVYFYDIARRVGVEKIAQMAERLGLGQTLLPELAGESAGLVPNPAWKEGAIGEAWQGGETLILGIGQGYLLATPLQLATMTARLANGKRAVSPRLVFRDEPDSDAPPLGMSQDALRHVRQGMFEVVNGKQGTARAHRLQRDDVQMAGKTGTSQVRRISRAERDPGC